MVISGSAVMILGAVVISSAIAGQPEQSSALDVLRKDCERYGMDYSRVVAASRGEETSRANDRRRWWDYLIVAAAVGIFVRLASWAAVPPIAMNLHWLPALAVVLIFSVTVCTWALWKTTRLS